MLTTVHVPMTEMETIAAKILIDRINGGHTLPMQIKLPFYLAKRESCAPPRKLEFLFQFKKEKELHTNQLVHRSSSFFLSL